MSVYPTVENASGPFKPSAPARPASRPAGERVEDVLADILGLLGDRPGQRLELAAQAVDLVEQRQHQRHRLLVDRAVAADLEDQPHARDVDLLEAVALRARLGLHPAA